MKDCFDICTITKCTQHGHDEIAPSWCLADPVIDRYEKRKVRKFPKICRTCRYIEEYQYKDTICWRCSNWVDLDKKK